MILVLTCEHAVNTIPDAYQSYFETAQDLLNTHAGMDFGALELAKYLAHFFNVTLHTAKASRLLIDCNRSLFHKHCFSAISNAFSKEMKDLIIEQYYLSYRTPIETLIAQHIGANNRVLHLSIHSFTPIFKGLIRNANQALLFDPQRRTESQLARAWQLAYKNQSNGNKLRLNYPYHGKSDGFTTTLRKNYSEQAYIGIEIEVNQNVCQDKAAFLDLKSQLAQSLKEVLNQSL